MSYGPQFREADDIFDLFTDNKLPINSCLYLLALPFSNSCSQQAYNETMFIELDFGDVERYACVCWCWYMPNLIFV